MQSAQFLLHADIEQEHWWFVGRRRIMQRLLAAAVPPADDCLVIDVGCGTGANIAALAGCYDCVGIDASEEAVELARARFPEVRFVAGMAPGDLGPLAAKAKAWLLMDVLEHVEDDCAMLSDLIMAASPGAHFLLTVPADPRLWSEHDESFGHFRRYDRARLRRLWDGLPVSELLCSYYNARLYPLIRLIRARNRRRGRSGGRAGTDFWMPAGAVNRLLRAILAGESRRLVGQLDGRSPAYALGASLIALLRREPAEVTTP